MGILFPTGGFGFLVPSIRSKISFTAETSVFWRDISYKFCGGKSGTGTGFSPNMSVLLCRYNFTNALFYHLDYVTRQNIHKPTRQDGKQENISWKRVISFRFPARLVGSHY